MHNIFIRISQKCAEKVDEICWNVHQHGKKEIVSENKTTEVAKFTQLGAKCINILNLWTFQDIWNSMLAKQSQFEAPKKDRHVLDVACKLLTIKDNYK